MKTPKKAELGGSSRAARRFAQREEEVVKAEVGGDDKDIGRALGMGGKEVVEEQDENQRKFGRRNKKSRSVESTLGSSTFRRVGETCLTADRG